VDAGVQGLLASKVRRKGRGAPSPAWFWTAQETSTAQRWLAEVGCGAFMGCVWL